MSTALPPIDNSLLPADVRTGTKTEQDNYKTGLAFERQLVEQLTQIMSDTTKAQDQGNADDSGDDGSSAATDSYKQMLPGAMADSIMNAGGLGLARTIADNLNGAGK
jgi:Rod binding domain-containing protein